MKTQWRKMESWDVKKMLSHMRPRAFYVARDKAGVFLILPDARGSMRRFASRAAALRAANAANRRDGLPEVA